MKLVVGLGNPGARYAATRHNAGARVVERFARDHDLALSERRFAGRFGRGHLARGAGAPEVALLVPETYMNRSGEAVAAALEGLDLESPGEDLVVAVDDLDLPFGRLRIRARGGCAGHRGLEDIAARLGTSDFARLRFGIGRPGDDRDAVDWVLEPFSNAEEDALRERIALAAEALTAILLDGVAAAMNRYNRDPEAAGA